MIIEGIPFPTGTTGMLASRDIQAVIMDTLSPIVISCIRRIVETRETRIMLSFQIMELKEPRESRQFLQPRKIWETESSTPEISLTGRIQACLECLLQV